MWNGLQLWKTYKSRPVSCAKRASEVPRETPAHSSSSSSSCQEDNQRVRVRRRRNPPSPTLPLHPLPSPLAAHTHAHTHSPSCCSASSVERISICFKRSILRRQFPFLGLSAHPHLLPFPPPYGPSPPWHGRPSARCTTQAESCSSKQK